jgi:tetratricopeptide (TPR) repeat protein
MRDGQGGLLLGELVPAPDPERLSAHEFPHLHTDHSLDFAMRRIAETGLKVLPVVSRTNIRELKGSISMDDILAAYAVGKVAQETEPTLAKGKPALLLGGVLGVLILLAVVGGFLSYYYRTERAGRAQHSYELGNQYLQRELYDEAIEQYRDALSVSHSNQYRLALAAALVKAGHGDEAAIYLKDVLRSDPTNAAANLGMARVAVQEAKTDEAVGYYHHAIYGSWSANTATKRAQARIELIHVLGTAGRPQQAQAELLALLSAMPGDFAIKEQVAQLTVEYGLPQQAANLFRELADRDANDANAWAGLGEAEYALADYGAARDALAAALPLNPNNTSVRKRLEAATQILALDPMRRGLSERERFERSQAVLAGVLDTLDRCSLAKDQMETARRLMVKGRRPVSYGDAIEKDTTVAEQLWMAGAKACGSMPPADAPLSRVMARLLAR